jgi:serine/threonine protein phosphatase PrpC
VSLREALEIASLTDPGLVRDLNEDSIAADADLGYAILADGMGGYNAGEVASGMTVSLLAESLKAALRKDSPLDPPALLAGDVARVNAAVYEASRSDARYAGMGTTLVAVLFHDDRITVAHVGDSRLYRLRGERLEQVTRDHSLLQEQIDSGLISPEDARLSANKNLVTRALGIDPFVEVEVRQYEALPGDIYLLCSDGLNDMVADEEIQLTLNLLGANLELAAQQLVQMANDNGGRDNISVILARVLRPFPDDPGWIGRMRDWLRK